jgi:ABC-type polysaccharide/polyol phosphate transport system ATPase subunit
LFYLGLKIEFYLSKINMLKIGLTGGIGSGKSTVAKILKHWAYLFIMPMMLPKN